MTGLQLSFPNLKEHQEGEKKQQQKTASENPQASYTRLFVLGIFESAACRWACELNQSLISWVRWERNVSKEGIGLPPVIAHSASLSFFQTRAETHPTSAPVKWKCSWCFTMLRVSGPLSLQRIFFWLHWIKSTFLYGSFYAFFLPDLNWLVNANTK